ncbi:hypothetical protein ACFW2V_12930 [Streptomyces sp. NPDC058947]|uniref:hypothetical protein n=1 Tax=Streptomyces sp. NPDC058947 TaxID=3346675 RepID=UPI00367E9B70
MVHKNPHDPDDPTEFGHHMPLQALANRKEMWGLPDFASTLDMELKDLERYYYRQEQVDYGPHPVADMTTHYFEAPPERMKSFAPGYVMDRVSQGIMPATTDGVMRMCIDVTLSGVVDVKKSLASPEKMKFPCKGMTGLSSDSVTTRSDVMRRMEEQTQQIELVPSKPLDAIRQLLTDRERELEEVRNRFVEHVLVETQVPEIMRQRTVNMAARQGLLPERWTA